MIQLPDKKAIQSAFDRAATRYDQASSVQKKICQQLLDGLNFFTPPHQTFNACRENDFRVLDAGCGTGFGSGLIAQRFPQAQITQLDLSLAMLQQTLLKHKVVGDLEQLPLSAQVFRLYWSSLSVQWCELNPVLSEAFRVLKPGGQIAMATLGISTFDELKQTFAQIDHFNHTLEFVDSQAVFDAAASAGFQNIKVCQHTETTYHHSVVALLHSIKAVGANQIPHTTQSRKLNRTALKQLANAYESLRTDAGLPLSYQVIRLYADR